MRIASVLSSPMAATVAAAYALTGAALASSRVSVDPATTTLAYAVFLFPLLLALYARWRGMAGMGAGCAAVGAMLLVSAAIGILSYVAIGLGHPLADGQLKAWDAALGFDWPGFIRWLEARPALAAVLGFAYATFPFQILGLPFWLALRGDHRGAAAFVFVFAAMSLATCAISVFFPSPGAYVAHGFAPGDLVAIKPVWFLDEFLAVHGAAAFTFRFETMEGILTFPSLHAAVAVLCGWAGWRLKFARWPLAALNAVMFLSAISHGGHFLVDVLAGFVLAVATILPARRLFGEEGRTAIWRGEAALVPAE